MSGATTAWLVEESVMRRKGRSAGTYHKMVGRSEMRSYDRVGSKSLLASSMNAIADRGRVRSC